MFLIASLTMIAALAPGVGADSVTGASMGGATGATQAPVPTPAADVNPLPGPRLPPSRFHVLAADTTFTAEAATGYASVSVDTENTLTPVRSGDSAGHATRRDTTVSRAHKRPKAFEYSEWYDRRLTIHRWASYATLPLFVAQYITGEQLLKQGRYASPARYIHGPVATAIAGLFVVNTVTGVWNLSEAWPDPAGRTRRTIHSVLMLLSDAGFVVAGEVAKPGLNSAEKRRLHARVALTSMGVSLVGYAIMLPPFRGD